jgi:hypothetical protein
MHIKVQKRQFLTIIAIEFKIILMNISICTYIYIYF